VIRLSLVLLWFTASILAFNYVYFGTVSGVDTLNFISAFIFWTCGMF
jgi:hypothetical protein